LITTSLIAVLQNNNKTLNRRSKMGIILRDLVGLRTGNDPFELHLGVAITK